MGPLRAVDLIRRRTPGPELCCAPDPTNLLTFDWNLTCSSSTFGDMSVLLIMSKFIFLVLVSVVCENLALCLDSGH